MNNKDIYLIGEAYKKQVLEASKSELAMPVIKDAVLKDLNRQLEINKPKLQRLFTDPRSKNYVKELIKARDQLKFEQDNQRIFNLIEVIRDLSNHFGLYVRIPKAFEGLGAGSLGKNFKYLGSFGKDKGTLY